MSLAEIERIVGRPVVLHLALAAVIAVGGMQQPGSAPTRHAACARRRRQAPPANCSTTRSRWAAEHAIRQRDLDGDYIPVYEAELHCRRRPGEDQRRAHPGNSACAPAAIAPLAPRSRAAGRSNPTTAPLPAIAPGSRGYVGAFHVNVTSQPVAGPRTGVLFGARNKIAAPARIQIPFPGVESLKNAPAASGQDGSGWRIEAPHPPAQLEEDYPPALAACPRQIGRRNADDQFSLRWPASSPRRRASRAPASSPARRCRIRCLSRAYVGDGRSLRAGHRAAATWGAPVKGAGRCLTDKTDGRVLSLPSADAERAVTGAGRANQPRPAAQKSPACSPTVEIRPAAASRCSASPASVVIDSRQVVPLVIAEGNRFTAGGEARQPRRPGSVAGRPQGPAAVVEWWPPTS